MPLLLNNLTDSQSMLPPGAAVNYGQLPDGGNVPLFEKRRWSYRRVAQCKHVTASMSLILVISNAFSCLTCLDSSLATTAGTFVLTDVSLTRADASTLSTPATLRAGAALTSDAGTLNLGNAHITAPAAGAPAGSVTVDTALHVADNVAIDGTTVSINGYTVGVRSEVA